MDGSKICRFCLKVLYGNNLDKIENITIQMLEALLLKLDLDVDLQAVMCSECAIKLQNAVDFKTECLNAQHKQLSSEQTGVESIEEGSLKELIDITKCQKVCQFYLKMTEAGCYVYLQENKKNIIIDLVQKHIPELHLYTTEEVISCKVCLKSLQDFSRFVTSCLDSDEKIKGCKNVPDINTQLGVKDIQGFPLKCEISHADAIKQEENYDKSDIAVNVKEEYEDTLKVEHEELNIKYEDTVIKAQSRDCDSFPKTTSQERLKHLQASPSLIGENNIDKHLLIDEIIETKLYQCNRCLFETKRKHNLKTHMLIHQVDSNIPVFKCEQCPFLAIRKRNLNSHLQTHRDKHLLLQENLEIKQYKCDRCSYKTKRKRNLKSHMLIHQDSVDIPVYKCESCVFQTIRKHNLKRHLLIHQDLSEVEVYKCQSCLYITKCKEYLIKHMLVHQNPLETVVSDISLHNCNRCSFNTKYKSNLKLHMLIHQDSTDKPVYKCERCTFQTIRKHSLRRHRLIHQDLSEVEVYKCKSCSYITKCKDYLKRHMLVHQNLSETVGSEILFHNCNRCSFKTKYKCNLNAHFLTHQDGTERTMHKCEKCPYKTICLGSLRKHLKSHRDVNTG